MNKMTIEEVYETWLNGNISDAKKEIKRMSKSAFLDFVEFTTNENTYTYNDIRKLLS